MDVNTIGDDFETQFIRFTVRVTAFDASACHEDRIAIGVMIAPEDLAFRSPSFSKWRSAKFAAPNNSIST